MKKSFLGVLALLALIGCDKSREMTLMETVEDKSPQAAITANSIKVGEVSGLVITADMPLLEDFSACILESDQGSNLEISQVEGEYYLQGLVTDLDTLLTFAVSLHQVENELYWLEDSDVLTCKTLGNSACDINLTGGSEFFCSSNSSNSCEEDQLATDKKKGRRTICTASAGLD